MVAANYSRFVACVNTPKHHPFRVSPGLRWTGARQRSGSQDIHEKATIPVAHPPSHVLFHLREVLNKELDIQESLGIIESVEGPKQNRNRWFNRLVKAGHA